MRNFGAGSPDLMDLRHGLWDCGTATLVDLSSIRSMHSRDLVEGKIVKMVPPSVRSGLDDLFDRRVKKAPRELLRKLIDSNNVNYSCWYIDNILSFFVGSYADINAAKTRERKYGNPFPSLVRPPDIRSAMFILDGVGGHFVSGMTLNVDHGYAVTMDPGGTAAFNKARIEFKTLSNEATSYVMPLLCLYRANTDIEASLFGADIIEQVLVKSIANFTGGDR